MCGSCWCPALPLITCEALIAESCYLLRNLRGAPERILENVTAGVFQIPFQFPASGREVQRIMRQYRDRGIDFADACIIAMANEFGTGDILTLDRDFHVYRWGRKNPFRLLIALDQ